MAMAYKCDRCGVFYEKKPENKTNLIIYKNLTAKDICQGCLDEFVRFWFEPANAKKEKKDDEG